METPKLAVDVGPSFSESSSSTFTFVALNSGLWERVTSLGPVEGEAELSWNCTPFPWVRFAMVDWAETAFVEESFHPKGTFTPAAGSRVHHLKNGLIRGTVVGFEIINWDCPTTSLA